MSWVLTVLEGRGCVQVLAVLLFFFFNFFFFFGTSCFKILDKLEASRVTLFGLFLMLLKDVPKLKRNQWEIYFFLDEMST